jgi:hypothetical protein
VSMSAVIQSLYQKEEVKDFVAEYGQVIVDECHHISAFTFEQVRALRFLIQGTRRSVATPARTSGPLKVRAVSLGVSRGTAPFSSQFSPLSRTSGPRRCRQASDGWPKK